MKRKLQILSAAILALVAVGYAADELTTSIGWTYNKNGRKRTLAPTAVQWDITGNYVIENVQLITSVSPGQALSLGSVTTNGFGYFKNSETTNYTTNFVDIGVWDASTNFIAFLRLYAGQSTPTWLCPGVIVAKANSSSVKLDYVIADK